MNRPSAGARLLIERYKAVERISPGDRARLLANIRALLASHCNSIRPPRLPSHRRVLSLSAPLPCQRRSYGASGVNFHGGESGMDGNKAFYYSPIEENDGVVTNVNPLFYGMLLFSLAGSGKSLATTAVAGDVPFTAYTIALPDGSTSVVLDNKDTTRGVRAVVNVGTPVTAASAIYLQGPSPASLTAKTGITLAGAGSRLRVPGREIRRTQCRARATPSICSSRRRAQRSFACSRAPRSMCATGVARTRCARQ
jgi:hypothetical protein